jgi:hypothetical protein
VSSLVFDNTGAFCGSLGDGSTAGKHPIRRQVMSRSGGTQRYCQRQVKSSTERAKCIFFYNVQGFVLLFALDSREVEPTLVKHGAYVSLGVRSIDLSG